jgi:hypothetical protein
MVIRFHRKLTHAPLGMFLMFYSRIKCLQHSVFPASFSGIFKKIICEVCMRYSRAVETVVQARAS